MADYATKAELKARVDKTGVEDDAVFDALLTAASRAIDGYTNRPDGYYATGAASARYYSGSGNGVQPIDECVSVSEVAVKDDATDTTYTVWASTDYILASGDPEKPEFNRTPYTLLLIDPAGDYSHFLSGRFSFRRGFRPDPDQDSRGVKTVRVTAVWGKQSTIPAVVKEATLILASRWWKRGQSAWADTVGDADTGILMYRKEVDPDVAFLLRSGRLIRPAIG